jgi:hypothetical protein
MLVRILISIVCQVHPMSAPEVVPPHLDGLRRVRRNRGVGADGLPNHSGWKHSVQGMASIHQKVNNFINSLKKLPKS